MRTVKPVFYAYRIYEFLVFMPLMAAITVVMGASAVLLSLVSQRLGSKCGVVWARLISAITPMFVRVSGRENVDPERSYVVVSNHQSHFDILVIYGWLGIDFKWVMKIELRKVPVIGYACYRLGHVFVDRSNRRAAVRSIQEARRRITGGTSIFFFPEGTRSRTGELLEFKKGAFQMALAMGLPILPVTLVGTRDVLPSHSLALFPGRARLVFHPPIDTAGCGSEHLGELMARARLEIERGRDERSTDPAVADPGAPPG